ncbi:class I SAM-dependent methyltransferase [Falsiroseomonas sp. HC035]|uniref:class I SAM-dependent methyltransferase n=1 Tax=Falsiroseomonas sp. HC035 TaxID=3390999 RepID=UPI003D320A37
MSVAVPATSTAGAVARGVRAWPSPRRWWKSRAPEALDDADARFDAVAGAFGTLHLAEPDRALAEAFRVLRPGGTYAFTVWDGPGRATFFGTGFQAIIAHAGMNVPVPPDPTNFQAAGRNFTAAFAMRCDYRGHAAPTDSSPTTTAVSRTRVIPELERGAAWAEPYGGLRTCRLSDQSADEGSGCDDAGGVHDSCHVPGRACPADRHLGIGP